MTDTLDIILKDAKDGDLFVDCYGLIWEVQQAKYCKWLTNKNIQDGRCGIASHLWHTASVKGLKPYVEKKEEKINSSHFKIMQRALKDFFGNEKSYLNNTPNFLAEFARTCVDTPEDVIMSHKEGS